MFTHTHTKDDFFMAYQPLVGQALLNVEASRSHSDTPYSVGLLRLDGTLHDNTQNTQETDIHAPGGIRIRRPEAADT